jgi:hypothetical protein
LFPDGVRRTPPGAPYRPTYGRRRLSRPNNNDDDDDDVEEDDDLDMLDLDLASISLESTNLDEELRHSFMYAANLIRELRQEFRGHRSPVPVEFPPNAHRFPTWSSPTAVVSPSLSPSLSPSSCE